MRSGATEGGRLTAVVITASIILASALFVAGLILFLARGGASQPFQVHSLADLVGNAISGIVRMQPRGFIEAGLLVLLLAPFLRLIAGVVQSTRGRDWRFVIVGVVVAGLLLTGIVLGTGA
jgi:uncharacterized membrane protein